MTTDFDPRHFNPKAAPGATADTHGQIAVPGPDGSAYVYNPSIVLAVNVALSTQRPLLLAGSPGTGKTVLAANVAHVLGWRYYQRTVNSRTRARDLMWSMDTMRRLADAQASAALGAGSLKPREAYVEPQVLWWAFDRSSAVRRGAAPGADKVPAARDPCAGHAGEKAVVLLDEIDKAEPDLPNDLLEALDTERFTVDEVDPPLTVAARKQDVLLMITTNGERQLPPAFYRRCIVLKLESPSEDWLVNIANHRFGSDSESMHRTVARRVLHLRDAAMRLNQRPPSTAEYLDALAACTRLGIREDAPEWRLLEQSVLWKRDDPLPAGPGA